MSVRVSFVEQFGEKAAQAVETAAESHKNGLHDNPGSDHFKWAICICLGYECLERFADEHGFEPDFDRVREWIKNHGDLESHDGDVDYISAVVGVYNEFMPEPPQ